MQFNPRFTGEAESPFTATILSLWVATMIPHPVPQKRHTALSQRQSLSALEAALWIFRRTLILSMDIKPTVEHQLAFIDHKIQRSPYLYGRKTMEHGRR